MDGQFWWFYDLIFLAVGILILYLSAKKGISKTFIVVIGYGVSFLLGNALSDDIASAFYSNTIKRNDITNMTRAMEKSDISEKYKVYIESLGYNVKLDVKQIDKILSSGENISDQLFSYCKNNTGREVDSKENFNENITVGFSEVLKQCISGEMSAYTLVDIEERVAENLDFAVSGVYNDTTASVAFIEENYTRDANIAFLRSIFLIIIVLVCMIVFKIVSEKINSTEGIRPFGIIDHTLGGIFGLVEVFFIIVIISVFVKILVILGDNNMVLFNEKTIDNTIVFKYIYKLKYIN